MIPHAFLILLVLSLTSCGLEKASTGPEPTRFLKSTGTDMSEKKSRLPFAHSWRDPKIDMAKYKYIIVRPVTTAFLKSENWQESKSTYAPNKRSYLRRCNALATRWTKSLNQAFSSPICVFYKTTDASQPGTLILEVALTEVIFKNTATPSLPSGNVTGVITGLPTCAFEARVTDASTGAIISTVADRRGPTIHVLDTEKTSPSQANESICYEWSQQLMEASNKEIFPTVKRNWFDLF